MMETIKDKNKTAKQLVKKLQESGIHIATAESCTGGMVAAGIVEIPGASNVFEEGYVTYSNRIKQKLLSVREETLEQYTAVSGQTAEEMAKGMAKASGAELTVSVTGYAGPEDGPDGTPKGTVYIGTFFNGSVLTRQFCFQGDRTKVREQAVWEAYRFAEERISGSE